MSFDMGYCVGRTVFFGVRSVPQRCAFVQEIAWAPPTADAPQAQCRDAILARFFVAI